MSYFTGTDPDPALDDNKLQTKLIENQKYHLRINEIIDKYVCGLLPKSLKLMDFFFGSFRYAAEQEKTINDLKKLSASEMVDGCARGSMDENENNKENEVTNGPEEVSKENSSDEENDEIDDDDDDSGEEVGSPDTSTSHINRTLIDEEIILSDDDELVLC